MADFSVVKIGNSYAVVVDNQAVISFDTLERAADLAFYMIEQGHHSQADLNDNGGFEQR